MEDNELYHYGVKGMKWGIRRTPAQLGHKTAKKSSSTVKKAASSAAKAVSKAYSVHKAKAQAKKQAKENVESNKKIKKKSVEEMTDAELQQRIRRMQLEQQYNQLNPKKVSAGEKFVKTVGDAVVPALQSTGRKALEKALSDALGLDKKILSEMDRLRQETEKSNLKTQQARNEDYMNSRNKKDPLEDLRREAEASRLRNQMDRDKTAMDERAQKREEAKRQRDSQPTEADTYESPSSDRRKSYVDNVVDVEWSTTPVSELSRYREISSGQNYVRGLLEDPNRKRR